MTTARPRALAADDDPDLLLLVGTRLQALGYDVSTAEDGDAAVRAARECRPQLAVLDISMPKLDGLEVTRRLRSDPSLDGTAVILLTARALEEDIVRGYDAGAVAYITKPFSPREFEEAVRRVQAEQHEAAAHDETRRLAEAEAAYARVAQAVAAEPVPRSVFGLAVREAGALTGAGEARLVAFLDDDRARVVGSWTRPPATAEHVGAVVALCDEEVLAHVHATGVPARAGVAGSGLPHRLAVPVLFGTGVWGAIAIASDDPACLDDPATAERLTRFARLLELAVVNAETRTRLATMASTDHLTGLPNGRAFDDRLAEEVTQGQRLGRPVSLVVMDIDHFKSVNDTHGHDAGNAVLGDVARRLGALVRSGETMARVGGEEFAWVLPGTDAAQAAAAAERARSAIAGAPFGEVGLVTVSAGVCDLAEAADAHELFRLADLALYWAKRGGRDRVVRFAPSVVERFAADEAVRRRDREQALAGIAALARTVDAKDPTRRRHSERVSVLAGRLAEAAGWPPEQADLLAEAALVHDVGKVSVPDRIILKPGPLTAEEIAVVRAHAAAGAGIVSGVLTDQQTAWVRGHHERHDGRGYPDGLAGDDIPVGARLLAMAEAWDAMTSARPHRPPRNRDDALAEVRRECGRQFAPEAVEALERVIARTTGAGRS